MTGLPLKQRLQFSRFFAGEKTVVDPVTLSHRRIFILPSKQGFGFVLLIIILLLIAFVYNNNLIYLLTFLLASVFFITILHSFKALSGLVVGSARSHNVFAGQAAEFNIIINNPTPVLRFNLQVKLENTEIFDLPAYSKTTIKLSSVTRVRGWHDLKTVTVFNSYPLGLFHTWSPLNFNQKVLVYPKPSSLELPFPDSAKAEAGQGSQQKAHDDFYGLKEYQAGDAIKHIHWKAYAKGQGVFSKQYDGGKSSDQIWLDYAQCPGNHMEERISQLCRWVIDAEQAGLQYGFILPDLHLEPDNGSSHYQKCLKALALF